MSCAGLAAFWWEQPAWLIVVLALGCAAYAVAWLGRDLTGSTPTESSSPSGAAPVPDRGRFSSWRARVRLVVGALVGTGAVGLGAGLTSIGTSAAYVLLGILSFFAAVLLTMRLYRQPGAAPALRGPNALLRLRCLAWLILLVLLARPVWDWAVVTWQKPLLVVLLDDSDSMGIADPGLHAPRAQVANAVFDSARDIIKQLGALYEVRLRGIGTNVETDMSWKIVPAAPLSPLANAVRDAGALRSACGEPPRGVLLVSDGAENASPPGDVRRAAAVLAAQGTALWGVGVGPAPGTTPLVEVDPLALPARLDLRDRLRAPVSARAQGCAGATLTVAALWDGQVTASQSVPVERDTQHLTTEFDLIPPGPGLHRLSVRVTFPAKLGGGSFETHAVIDVREERIRVLWLEGAPRAEAAFVTRILQNDSQLELTRRFLFSEPGRAAVEPPVWADYDVAVLGGIPPMLSETTLDELSKAVMERGVGLLLAGGRRLLNDSDHAHADLAAVSPVRLVRDDFGLTGPVRFVPTELGLRHPVLQAVGLDEATASQSDKPDERAPWLVLPPLGGAALLGDPKPAAAVLAEDGAGQPLLVAQEVGRGRCIAAAWENTWPWALASSEGAVLHRRLWRQLVAWLANRRPQAWVLTDEPSYALAALTVGGRRVRIRAGLSGLETIGQIAGKERLSASLKLVKGDQQSEVPLERHGEEWTAELANRAGEPGALRGGEYTLEFGAGSEVDGAPSSWEARTTFAVTETALEREPPTANLALLRTAAQVTAPQGGSYSDIHELPALLTRLAQTDHRRELWSRQRFAAVERVPGVLLLALIILLGLEWVRRKRAGLA